MNQLMKFLFTLTLICYLFSEIYTIRIRQINKSEKCEKLVNDIHLLDPNSSPISDNIFYTSNQVRYKISLKHKCIVTENNKKELATKDTHDLFEQLKNRKAQSNKYEDDDFKVDIEDGEYNLVENFYSPYQQMGSYGVSVKMLFYLTNNDTIILDAATGSLEIISEAQI